MAISDEDKKKRIGLANLLLSDVLFLFALAGRIPDKKYLSETLKNRYRSSLSGYIVSNKKIERYLSKITGNIVNTTVEHLSEDYSMSGTSRYGTPEELGNEAHEMTVAQDRSFTFTIDRKNYDDYGGRQGIKPSVKRSNYPGGRHLSYCRSGGRRTYRECENSCNDKE